VSLGLLANQALDSYDILSSLAGQTMTGSIPGGSWSLVVTGTSYGDTDVAIGPENGGAAFTANVHDVQVHGTLTIKLLLSKTDDVTISAKTVRVDGAVNAGLSGSSLYATGDWAQATIMGFGYDSGNAGLPCCVDSILTGYLKPKVEDAVVDQINGIMSQELAFALEQFALPESIDLSSTGFPTQLGIDTHFDGASFDAQGVTLSAAARFTAPLEPGDVGADAPGWLTVAQPLGPQALDPSFAISMSLDALNQALHAAWAQNGLSRQIEGIDQIGTVFIEPRLPPVVLPNAQGGLTAQAGEIVLYADFNGQPIQIALSVIDDVQLQLDPTSHTLQLIPAPNAVVSVNWLAAGTLPEALREIIRARILEMVPTFLSPLSLPLPTLPLGAIAPAFEGSIGALGQATQLFVASDLARLQLHGDLAILPAP